jgi:hypothetical protein
MGGCVWHNTAMKRSKIVLSAMALAGALGWAAGCGNEDAAPQGKIRLTVAGLVGAHTITASAVEPRPVIDLSDEAAAVVEFDNVGNGNYSRMAPARSYEFFCGMPQDASDRYDLAEFAAAGGVLSEGGSLSFECTYVERAVLSFVFVGLDATIPGDWGVATIVAEPSGHESTVIVDQSGEQIRLRPGSYAFGCNGVVGNDATSRFVLASISTEAATLGSGEAVTVTCTFEPS